MTLTILTRRTCFLVLEDGFMFLWFWKMNNLSARYKSWSIFLRIILRSTQSGGFLITPWYCSCTVQMDTLTESVPGPDYPGQPAKCEQLCPEVQHCYRLPQSTDAWVKLFSCKNSRRRPRWQHRISSVSSVHVPL